MSMLKDFDFDLPQALIAQYPIDRGKSALLHRTADGNLTDMKFSQICDLLQSGDVLVLNNTRVIPSCLRGHIDGIELQINLINRAIDCDSERWEFLSKPRKKVKLGSIVRFSHQLVGVVIEKCNQNMLDVMEFFISPIIEVVSLNKCDIDDHIHLEDTQEATGSNNQSKTKSQQNRLDEIRFIPISPMEFFNLLDKVGEMPLPPYMKRTAIENDQYSYQTVFAQSEGSVAAPTAGLHFSHDLLDKIQSKGVKIAYITLHIGGGTFLPVRVNNISHHKMHSEFYSIGSSTCDLVNHAKLHNNRVIAVGTTVTRTLESAAEFCGGEILCPHTRYTDIFIRENYKFKVVDCLITNFHLPKSTLFILVCAFIGSTIEGQKLYKHAIDNQYRFFSYGDACFLMR